MLFKKVSGGLYFNAQYGLYITKEQLLKLKKQKKCVIVGTDAGTEPAPVEAETKLVNIVPTS